MADESEIFDVVEDNLKAAEATIAETYGTPTKQELLGAVLLAYSLENLRRSIRQDARLIAQQINRVVTAIQGAAADD